MADRSTDRLSDRDAGYVLAVRHGTFSTMRWLGWLFAISAGTSFVLGAVALLSHSVAPLWRPDGWTTERIVTEMGYSLLFFWLGVVMLDVTRCHRIIAAMAANGDPPPDCDRKAKRDIVNSGPP